MHLALVLDLRDTDWDNFVFAVSFNIKTWHLLKCIRSQSIKLCNKHNTYIRIDSLLDIWNLLFSLLVYAIYYFRAELQAEKRKRWQVPSHSDVSTRSCQVRSVLITVSRTNYGWLSQEWLHAAVCLRVIRPFVAPPVSVKTTEPLTGLSSLIWKAVIKCVKYMYNLFPHNAATEDPVIVWTNALVMLWCQKEMKDTVLFYIHTGLYASPF